MDAFNAGRRSTVFTNAPAGLLFAGRRGLPRQRQHLRQPQPVRAARRAGLGSGRRQRARPIRAAVGVYYDSPKLWQYGRHPLNAPYGNTIQVNQPASFNDPWAAYPGGNPFPIPFPPPADVGSRRSAPT